MNSNNHFPVIIAGAGPVGLFLGHCLYRKEIPFRILEKETELHQHSRSIGIHPVSIAKLANLNLLDDFLHYGVKVQKGHAFVNRDHIGTLNFSRLDAPYNYILTLPQYKTEQILEQRLRSLVPKCIKRGVCISGITENQQTGQTNIMVEPSSATERKRQSSPVSTKQVFSATYLVGCDGKDSVVRQESGIGFDEKRYGDTYIMGDFEDTTEYRGEACIYLHSDGVIESFPLPGDWRRWVVKVDTRVKDSALALLQEEIYRRIGIDLREGQNFMVSSFGTQRAVASTLFRNRIILAGDAAHVVSPIGGQGMNLGWLDAWDLAERLENIFKNGKQERRELLHYSRQGKKAARGAIRRSEFNMRMGRSFTYALPRKVILHLMLNTPLQDPAARVFTMQL